MRTDIEFDSDGVRLRGWLYSPEATSAASDARSPIVVMTHGFSAVKELHLDRYAAVFAAAGIAALVFDHRNFGASDGSPRQEIDPVTQVRDCRNAITFACTLPGIDANAVGVWGSSYSGGHALVLGATDRRVRCVVSQVPLISGSENIRRLVRADRVSELRAACDADRAARFAGAEPAYIPVVAEDPNAFCALPTADAYAWFTRNQRERAPTWRNEVTLRSVEMLTEYEPGIAIARISPTPLLLVVARDDTVAVTDLALAAYERALEPKRLVLVAGGHFDAYEAEFEVSSGAARRWFQEHLLGQSTHRVEPALTPVAANRGG